MDMKSSFNLTIPDSTVNSWWPPLWTCTSTASSTYPPRGRSSSKSTCYYQRSNWNFLESWKLLCFKEEFCNLELSFGFLFELGLRSALELGRACWSGSRSGLFGGHSLFCSAFVINLRDPIFIKFSCSVLCSYVHICSLLVNILIKFYKCKHSILNRNSNVWLWNRCCGGIILSTILML